MYRAPTKSWYLERIIWLLAGFLILLSVVLAWYVSPWRHILTLLVGVNLIIFSLTGYCLMAHVLTRLGFRSHLHS